MKKTQSLVWLGIFLCFIWNTKGSTAKEVSFKVLWGNQVLKTWSFSELLEWKKDVQNHGSRFFRGIEIKRLTHIAVSQLPLSKQPQVDLIGFQTQNGTIKWIPRFLIQKFHFLLALQQQKQGGVIKPKTEAAFLLVFPKQKLKKLEKDFFLAPLFDLSPVKAIVFAREEKQFSFIWLRYRKDPFLLRGELLFRKWCLYCLKFSLIKTSTERIQTFFQDAKEELASLKFLKKLDRQAIQAYLDQVLEEKKKQFFSERK